jgi:hypothetical protein
MTLVSSRSLPSSRPRVRTTQTLAKIEGRLDGPPAPRAGRHGRRVIAPRLGVLRLAPRLSIVPGTRRDANWPAIAGGLGVALGAEFDPDDGPLVA